MRYKDATKAEFLFVSLLVALSIIPTVLDNGRKMVNRLTEYFGITAVIFLFIALLSVNSTVYADFAISLKEVPQWTPGYPIKIRYIIVDDKGTGSVVIVSDENEGMPEVSEVELFRYNPATFAYWMSEYQEYKNFYGVDEDSDGIIVEGNPETVVLSFYSDGKSVKSVNLSGEFDESDMSNARFQLPASLIELRDKLLAYALKAEPQPKSAYYMTAVPYGENEKYWLLRSTKLESIPAITDLSDERGQAFLTKLVESAPAFLPLEETLFLELKNDMGLSSDQFKKIFRVSVESDIIVQIRLMKAAKLR